MYSHCSYPAVMALLADFSSFISKSTRVIMLLLMLMLYYPNVKSLQDSIHDATGCSNRWRKSIKCVAGWMLVYDWFTPTVARKVASCAEAFRSFVKYSSLGISDAYIYIYIILTHRIKNSLRKVIEYNVFGDIFKPLYYVIFYRQKMIILSISYLHLRKTHNENYCHCRHLLNGNR